MFLTENVAVVEAVENVVENDNAVKVDSSWIESIERVGNDRILVNLGAGDVREYKNISDKKYQSLIEAESVGAFFNYSIRNDARHQV